jgi:hypothetical protein
VYFNTNKKVQTSSQTNVNPEIPRFKRGGESMDAGVGKKQRLPTVPPMARFKRGVDSELPGARKKQRFMTDTPARRSVRFM